jgi:hypothetical protein
MSSCWKCGRELPEGQTECEHGCQPAELKTKEHEARFFDFAYVDWKKVKTLPDLIRVMSVIYDGAGVCTDEEDYEQIKDLCEPPTKISLDGDEI